MKKIVFTIFNYYNQKFPIKNGKHFVARILTLIFSSFTVMSKKGVYLDVFLTSTQDVYLINHEKEDLIINQIRMLKHDDIFVDIGTNIGYYSFCASKFLSNSASIFSFEPSIREYKRFINGIIKNECKNIIPYNIALSNTNGYQLFNVSEFHTGLNKLSLKTDLNSLKVPIMKFDDLFGLLDIQFIHLIKIDVEGAELLVLYGMENYLSRKKIGKVIVEITTKFLLEFSHTKKELYDYMYNLGYKSTINSNKWQYDEIFEPI
jgi:FkbM family methyltransferase